MSLPTRSQHLGQEPLASELDPEAVALWSILEQGSDGICLLAVETSGSGLTAETNFRFIAANRAAREMLICRTSEVKGLLLRECLPKAIAGQLWVHLYHGTQTGAPVEGELWVEQASDLPPSVPGYPTGSSVQKLKAKILKLPTPDKPNLVICLLQQPQKQEEYTEARLLATIAQDIAAAADFHTCIATAMERVCEATDWDYGEAWLPSADGGRLCCIAASYRGENPILENFKNKISSWTFLPNQGIPGRVWVSKQPEWHQDVSRLSPEIFHRVELAKTAGIKAALATPILEGEQVLAVLVFFKSTSRKRVSKTRGLDKSENSAPETRFLNRVVDIVLAISTQLGALIKLKQVEAALRQAERKYRSIFENSVEGIFQTTPDGRYLSANPMLARIYGYASPEALMEELQDIQHQLYVEPSRRAQFQQLLQETDAVWGFESQIYRKDGVKIWISENARAIKDSNGELLCYEGTVVDITQRKVAEAQLQRRDSLLQGVAEAMNYLLVEQRSYEAVKKALATLGAAAGVERVYVCAKKPHTVGYVGDWEIQFEWRAGVGGDSSSTGSPQPPLKRGATVGSPQPPFKRGATVISLVPETGAKSGVTLNQRLYSALVKGSPVIFRREQTENPFQESYREDLSVLMVPMIVNGTLMGYVGFEARNLSPDFCATIPPTETLLATEALTPLPPCPTGGDSGGGWSKSEESILGAIANSIGAALDRYHQEQAIRHQAYHDALTGLPNRQQLEEYLPQALENARATGEKVAVMFLDLDRFKLVNDSLGHAIGDQLLQESAHRLRRCIRDKDTIVRWGGDEFIIILEGILTHEDATHIANRILEVLRPALKIEGHELYISGSLGIALYPDDGNDAQTLMKNADLALYRVKENGRDNYQLYTAVMSLQPSELLTLTSELHMAALRNLKKP